MFYLKNNNNNIININMELDLINYKLIFKHKDEFNIFYEFDIAPFFSSKRYSSFNFNNLLKTGTYIFHIKNQLGDVVYGDICFVEFVEDDIIVNDDNDKKIIID